jgi:hypothetical protein
MRRSTVAIKFVARKYGSNTNLTYMLRNRGSRKPDGGAEGRALLRFLRWTISPSGGMQYRTILGKGKLIIFAFFY